MVGFFALVTDLTAIRRAKETLRLSELRYRLVCQAAKDAIRDWDLVTDW